MVARARVSGESTAEEVGTVIVWSKGLGKQSLPIELDRAELRVEKGCICVDGIIEPVWWQYTITLTAPDLMHFLNMLSSAKTASFVASERGIFLSFLRRLARFIPQVLLGLVRAKAGNMLANKNKDKEHIQDGILVRRDG